MNNKEKTAISPTRKENYALWYQEVIRASELAENSSARGCMVIKPWGWGIWEKVQRHLDNMIKDTGHENAYFPLFIPLRFMEREAEHVEGFAKECAVVTHHRLESRDGKLVPAGELEEPFIVRPTSETIIGESFAKWINSYRDLPLLINQWANVARWEMRPRLFLRTAEFLWQEGHTAHENQKEAEEEVAKMLEVYRTLAEEMISLPVIAGEKSAGERFPGAVNTLTIEAMMQDRKALQSGTSHYLGKNFARAAGIKFLDRTGKEKFAHTTSWGLSTRIIGALIMAHGDDDGLRVPPLVSPKHLVVLPVVTGDDTKEKVLSYAAKVAGKLADCNFRGEKIAVKVDTRDKRGGEKNWDWIKKGIPIRVEVGPRDVADEKVVVTRRDKGHREKEVISLKELCTRASDILEEIQQNYFSQAKTLLEENTNCDISTFAELKEFFTPKNADNPEIHGGFAVVKWAGTADDEKKLAKVKASIRCIPENQSGSSGKCIMSGKETTQEVVIAKAY